VNDRYRLEAAIAALEEQRSIVGDAVTDAALAPMRERLAGLQENEQSLRQVTVLFMDVVGSTALSRQLDPEDIHRIIDGALKRLTAIVKRHQGRVLQYAGDSLLAVFGAAESREDDPERAVRCGLDIVQGAQQIGAEVRATFSGGDFDVRVGIHTGSVLLGGGIDDTSIIRGIAVNIAARMEQTAPIGGVRISHETQRHVRGKFDLIEEPPIPVKGFAEPMRSHLVKAARARTLASVGRGIEGVATPMVGREAELAKLTEAYETAHDEHRLNLVTVSGDPGLGKSRLMVEFEHWLELGHPASVRLHGRPQPYSSSVPYGLLRDLLSWQFEILDSDSQALAQTKLRQGFALRFGENCTEQATLVGRLIGLDYGTGTDVVSAEGDGRQSRDRAFHVMAQHFRLLNKDSGAPVVLLLDDLHWADEGSLDFISYVARSCQDVPMLVLCLTRPELFERRPWWSSGRDDQLRIDLTPLSRRSSRDLAEALLARLSTVPAALRDLITGSAEGNPYFVEELIGMLLDDQVIVAEGDRWRVMGDRLLQVRVPSTLAGVLQARLDALPPQELIALRHASVIGHVFWDEALQVTTPVAPQLLENLVQRDLARRRDTSLFECAREFVFKHHLLHKVTYESVLKRDKRKWHRLTAEWLVARSGERVNEYIGSIADHFEKGEDTDNAVLYLCKAAGVAASSYAIEVALAYFNRALALMPVCPERFDVLRKLVVVAIFNKRVEDEHEQYIAEMESLAETLDDDERRALAASFRTTYEASLGDLMTTELAARKALAYAEISGSTAAAIRARNQWGRKLADAGQLDAAQEQIEQGLALARSVGNGSGEASALTQLARLADARGLYGEARQHLRGAVDIAQANKALVFSNELLCSLAQVDLSIGHYDRATEQLHSALNAFRVSNWPEGVAHASVCLAMAAYLRGEPKEAATWLDEAIAADPANEGLEFVAAYEMLRGDVNAALGKSIEAKSCYERSAAAHQGLSRPLAAIEMQAGLARLCLASGERLEAKKYVTNIVEQLEFGWSSGKAGTDPLRIMLTCHEVLAAVGDGRAEEFLLVAHSSLQARAEQLEATDKDAFLSNVPTNRGILVAWDALQRSRTE